MTLSIAPFSSSGDGCVRNMAQATWAAARGNASGTLAQPTPANTFGAYVGKNSASDWDCVRGFYAFDISAIPAGSVILSATLSVYVNTTYDLLGSGQVGVVAGTQASTSTLATSDFSLVGSTEFATRKTIAGLSTAAYTDFTLNASGIAHVQAALGGSVKLATRTGRDIDNSTPGSTNYEGILVYFSEQTGTSNDPYLTVTYALARSTSDTWAWSDTAMVSAIDRANGDSERFLTDTWAWSDTSTSVWSFARTTSDSWAWRDGAVPTQAAPSARTALGSAVTVFAPTAADGTFGAYRGFGSTAALADGRLLCVGVKASYHASPDSVLVAKYSSDGGATWGAEFSFPEVAGAEVTVLASGRLAAVTDDLGAALRYPEYIYSDDHGLTWSSPVTITWGFASGYTYANDVVELPNGDLLASAHGEDTPGGVQLLRWSKSTDDGATWAPLSSVAAIGGYNTVEQRCVVMNNGGVYAVFHTEDGIPTNYYYVFSPDGGATWETPVLIEAGNSFNRQGLTHFDDDRLIIGVNSDVPYTWRYREALDGHTYGTAVSIASSPSPRTPLKSAAVALPGGTGATQNVGFTYSDEQADQQNASTYYRQFSGTNGAAVWQRTTSDSWAWSDVATETTSIGKTTADSWAWSDAAQGNHRSTSDTWAWSDTATRTTINAKTTSDTWAWSDVAAPTVPGSSKTTSDTWAWSDTATRSAPKSRTTTDTWLWSEPPGVDTPTPLFWLRTRRRTMSAPTKTYVAVLPKGTTRTSSYTSPTYEAKTEAGILVVLDVTAASGTGGLTLRINAQDQASAQAVALNAAPTAVTAIGTTSYALYPFGAVAGNVTQATEFYLPRSFSISVTAGDSSSYTYSLGYCLLP